MRPIVVSKTADFVTSSKPCCKTCSHMLRGARTRRGGIPSLKKKCLDALVTKRVQPWTLSFAKALPTTSGVRVKGKDFAGDTHKPSTHYGHHDSLKGQEELRDMETASLLLWP